MNQSNDILEPRLVAVDSYHLEYINDQLVTLTIDAEHLAMAVQAIQTDDIISSGIINAVRIALCSNAALSQDLSDQLDVLLTSKGANDV